MRNGLWLVACVAAVVGALVALPGQSLASGGADGALCRAQTERQGRMAGLPAHMLTALSLVESGRWDAGRGEKVAWPWTINAAGEGKIFPTKAAAIAEVRRLQAEGMRSIDVGCMQVNLFYHGNAFPDLEAAFDPAANVAYAIDFLTRLKAETGSWQAAAVRYHSATPKYAARYQAKLTQELASLKELPGSSAGSTSSAATSSRHDAVARAAAQERARVQQERAARLAETAAQQDAARAFAEAWRSERLAAYHRARAEAS